MTTVAYNSIELQNLVGSFNGGLLGAPQKNRASQRSKVRSITFSFKFIAAGNITDNVTIARLFPTDYILDYKLASGLYGGNAVSAAMGTNVLANIGTTANNALIDTALNVAANGLVTQGTFLGFVSQLGTDPAGDMTSGQTPPNFGSAPIDVKVTLYNAAPAINSGFAGHLLVGMGN